jgi:dolichol-phosphate mannosyltransferase
MKVKNISLIVPCYNEVETVEEFYLRAAQAAAALQSKAFEFIFVNDGSSDGTEEILNHIAAKDSRVRVLHLAQNRGHQIALTAGIDHARGDMIVSIDGDLQDPPEVVVEMLAKVEEGYDVVHTQRRQRKGETWFKLFTARLFYALMSRLSGTTIIPNSGDFRAFTRPVQETLRAFRGANRFLRGTFVQIGFRQCVLPYDRHPRHAGRSKYPFLKMLTFAMDGILRFSSTPIHVIVWTSIALWIFSLLYFAHSLIQHFILQNTVTGWTSIIILLFFFTGLILFSLAIIGAYVGRIFLQSQNPPLYWLKDGRNIRIDDLPDDACDLRELQLSRRIIKGRGGGTS